MKAETIRLLLQEFEVLKVYMIGTDLVCFDFIAIGPPRPGDEHRGIMNFMKTLTWPSHHLDKDSSKEVLESLFLMTLSEIRMTMLNYYGSERFFQILRENQPYYAKTIS